MRRRPPSWCRPSRPGSGGGDLESGGQCPPDLACARCRHDPCPGRCLPELASRGRRSPGRLHAASPTNAQRGPCRPGRLLHPPLSGVADIPLFQRRSQFRAGRDPVARGRLPAAVRPPGHHRPRCPRGGPCLLRGRPGRSCRGGAGGLRRAPGQGGGNHPARPPGTGGVVGSNSRVRGGGDARQPPDDAGLPGERVSDAQQVHLRVDPPRVSDRPLGRGPGAIREPGADRGKRRPQVHPRACLGGGDRRLAIGGRYRRADRLQPPRGWVQGEALPDQQVGGDDPRGCRLRLDRRCSQSG